MQVEFVLGRAGSGKTTYCYQQIESELEKQDYSDLIMLVPEQFNLQTQIDLSKRLYSGLLRVEVASFNTLAREVFNEVGKEETPVIDDLERIMILKKVIEDHKDELVFFKKSIYRNGFIESINRLITVLEQSSIEEITLKEIIADKETTTLFKSKLQDIRIIYKYFQDYIAGKFITAEKTLKRVAQSICKSHKLRSAIIWIDGFYGFTSAQVDIIEELIKKSQGVKITLPSDKVYNMNDQIKEVNPFYESIKTYQKLVGLCESKSITYKTQYLFVNTLEDSGVSKEIRYIEQNYFNAYAVPFNEEIKDLSLCTYPNKNDEIERTAKIIVELIRNSGLRYRDLAIMVGDLAAYKSSIESIFKEYEIPYFLDMKRNIHTNSLVAAIEGVLEVITSNYSYRSMMSLLRTYMLNIAIEDIDLLENYILAYGIKGKKKWYETWEFNKEDLLIQAHINVIREKILEPIRKFEEYIYKLKTSGSIKMIDLTKGLYYFLEDIKAYEVLQECVKRHQKDQNRLLELENSQIWSEVIEVFERLVAILGEEYTTVAGYKRMISTSFSYLKMGTIPPAQDQVIIGTIDRTRLPRIKAEFILGTNEGIIPKISNPIELFSDMDKVTLSRICKERDSAKDRFCDRVINESIYTSNFEVYTALTRATDKLYISAVLADENGKPLRPSLVYYKIKKMFRGVQKQAEDHLLDHVQRPLPTFGYVGHLLREYIEGRMEEDAWKDIISWYFENEKWQDRLLDLSSYLFYTNQQHYLNEETTKLLYEPTLNTSISKLETFRNCACCYFIRYGIKAEERKIFTWDQAKIGTLFHAALEEYPKELEVLGTTWTSASNEQIDLAVKKATVHALEKHNAAYKDIGKFKYIASKLEKMARRAIRALTAHLQNGDFMPASYEVNFAEGKALPPIEISIDKDRKIIITGQIDRVDIYYKDSESQYIKILDYKTGNKTFNLAEVYYGLQLQLLLYLDAYLKLDTRYQPGGVFYFHINNPYINYEAGMSEEEIQGRNLKQFKLSGLALEALDVIHALDKTNLGDTIPVSINKDGTIKKGSSVASLQQFEVLENHIIDTIKDLGKQILEGKVSARPFKLGDKSSCLYCQYRTICQFDESMPDNIYEKLDYINKEAIWEKLCMRKEIE
ncbi:MAG: UvrD/REP helicase [Clostridia bacterium]|jgi:ATP-dependent helicase/nuclease subunit B|nr:UvrD/REP helicase [Clostridia bacterium]